MKAETGNRTAMSVLQGFVPLATAGWTGEGTGSADGHSIGCLLAHGKLHPSPPLWNNSGFLSHPLSQWAGTHDVLGESVSSSIDQVRGQPNH